MPEGFRALLRRRAGPSIRLKLSTVSVIAHVHSQAVLTRDELARTAGPRQQCVPGPDGRVPVSSELAMFIDL